MTDTLTGTIARISMEGTLVTVCLRYARLVSGMRSGRAWPDYIRPSILPMNPHDRFATPR